MPKLRWAIYKRDLNVKAADVHRYASAMDISLMTAKKILVGEEPPILEQYDEGTGNWSAIPVVVLQR